MTTTQTATAYPFTQGLSRDVVLRLLDGTHTRADRAVYYRTDWWRAIKGQALEMAGRSCALCGSLLNLHVHHKPQAYKRLFREHPVRDLTILCRTCHKRHHRR